MSRRTQILREMGLAPVWRLRSGTVSTEQASEGNEGRDESGQTGKASSSSSSSWVELKQAVPGCTACTLHKSRTQTVFGVGDENADWLIVGEAPGAEEDRLGDPFVGQAGKLLDNMLAAIGLDRRKNVYIANVLKCRPPGNRNPQPEEVASCSPYLQRQVALIQPRLIIAMGRFAAQTLLSTDATIASLRGRVHAYAGVPLIVTYHPAYLLRNLPDKAKAWADLLFAVKTINGVRSTLRQ
jgi:DNA polymerase